MQITCDSDIVHQYNECNKDILFVKSIIKPARSDWRHAHM